MIGVIKLDIYNLDIGVFHSHKRRRKELTRQGVSDPVMGNPNGLGFAAMDKTEDGEIRLSMVLPKVATMATWVHECSHICDFVMDALNLPQGIEGTEVRAYMIGHLFAGLIEIMGVTE